MKFLKSNRNQSGFQKKRILLSLWRYGCLGIFLFGIHACQQDEKLEADSGMPGLLTAEEAKSYFEENAESLNFFQPALLTTRSGHEKEQADSLPEIDPRHSITPLWDKAKSSTDGKSSAVEVELFAKRRIYFTYKKEQGQLLPPAHLYLNTMTKLVVERNEVQGVELKVVTFVADSAYLYRHPWDFKQVTTLQPRRFCGKMIFSDLSGQFLEGYVYKEGKRVAMLSLGERGPITTRNVVEDQRCETYWVDMYEESCWTVGVGDWEDPAGNYGEVSGCDYIYAGSYQEEVCTTYSYDDGCGNGGPGGDYGSGNGTSTGTLVHAPYVDAVYKASASNLTDDQRLILNALLEEWGEEFPVFNRMMDELATAGIEIGMRIDAGKTKGNPGRYDYVNQVIYFRDQECLGLKSLLEEFIHVAQFSLIYTKANNPGVRTIEFEAKVFFDINCKYDFDNPYYCGWGDDGLSNGEYCIFIDNFYYAKSFNEELLEKYHQLGERWNDPNYQVGVYSREPGPLLIEHYFKK